MLCVLQSTFFFVKNKFKKMSQSDDTAGIVAISVMGSALLFASATAWTKAFEYGLKEYFPLQNDFFAWIAYSLFITLLAFIVVMFVLRKGGQIWD
jgi:hypothetical protein